MTLREREVTMRPGGDEKRYEAKAERLEVNAAAVMASQGRRPGTTVDWECAGDRCILSFAPRDYVAPRGAS